MERSAAPNAPGLCFPARTSYHAGISQSILQENKRMKRTQSVFLAALLLVVATAAGAQVSLTLGVSKTAPKVDGVVSPDEYAVTSTSQGLQVSLAWTADGLFVAVVGPTTGWVAAGLGSNVMDTAVIYIGFVSGDQVQFKVQKGIGHSHDDATGFVPLQYAMKEANAQTVLELQLKPADFIAKGQKQLGLIAAAGGSDSFFAMHRQKARFLVALAQ
jgi:hypothetical protein